MQTVRQILTNMKTKYMKKVTIYRLQRLMRQRAQFVAERFRFFTIFCSNPDIFPCETSKFSIPRFFGFHIEVLIMRCSRTV